MPAIEASYGYESESLGLFHAVAQAGNVSRGAVSARVSQPAVSKQITELEDAPGVRLLERLKTTGAGSGCRFRKTR